MTGAPFTSGGSTREQGIGKNGSPRVAADHDAVDLALD
jgi:hypothetical protein